MSNTHSASLSISTIDVSLASVSQKKVGSIKLSTSKGLLKDINTTLPAGHTYQEKFDPPLIVTSDDRIIVSVHCDTRYWKHYDLVIDIDARDVEWHEEKGVKTYRKAIRNVEVVITSSPSVSPPSPKLDHDPHIPDAVSQAPGKLVPRTDDLIRTCAKFRILIIGNSGVGKSTLIRKMFGVKDVHASDTVRGVSEIDREFTSEMNTRFVVHDSLGFEAGDDKKMKVVKEFVKRRQGMPRLEDQLHAIWLCVEIPFAGGRLAERGVEELLQNQRDIIGNIPLIVVLTKVDLLDIQLDLELQGTEPLVPRRSRHLDKYCIAPLRKAAGPGRDVTCVAVSAKEGYYILISDLMKATQENMVNNAIHEAPRALACIAQRVDFKEKIKMSIDVGAKKYWKNLLTSAVFRGRTLEECLEVIRKDIVTVWNFVDLDYGLLDEKLIKTSIPDNISPSTIRIWTTNLDDSDFLQDLARNVTSTMSALLRLPYDIYKEAILDVEILMAYTVDLICVMQVIFLLAPDGPVARDIVDRAIEKCESKRKEVHESIKRFDKKQAVRAGQDRVLKEIEALIWRYCLSDEEMAKLRQEVGTSSDI